jgi:hypothetical protein
MDKFLDIYDHPKLKQQGVIHLNRNWSSNKEYSRKVKGQEQMDSLLKLPDFQRKTNTNSPQTFPWNRNGRNTAKLVLWNQHHTHLKSGQGHSKIRKIQASFFNEHRCENPQKNIGKQNSIAHQKDHAPCLSQFHHRMLGWFNIYKSLNVMQHFNRSRQKPTWSSP